MKQILNLLILIGTIFGQNQLAVQNPEGHEYRVNCVQCVLYGYTWCGDYSSFSAFTKCAERIDPRLCKVKMIYGNADLCSQESLNPDWGVPGRASFQDIPSDGGLWDPDCSKTINIMYGEAPDFQDIAHSLKKFSFCLVKINNFSGKNQTVEVSYDTTNEQTFRLYRLDNTDEMQWKTITFMEEQIEAEMAAQGLDHDDEEHMHDSQKKYTIISGMGKAVYVMNLDMQNPVSFNTKITVESSGFRLGLSALSLLLLIFAF